MLGFFTAVTGAVGRDSMEAAVKASVRERFVELNMKAFEEGYAYPRQEA